MKKITKKMTTYISDMKRDVEAWIAYYVLQDTGYNIEDCYDIKNGFEKLKDIKYPIIICIHSSPYGLILQTPSYKKRSLIKPEIVLDHFLFSKENQNVYKLFTCFLDFETQTSTPFINLPGYDEFGRPGYWKVDNIRASNYYRHWIGNMKAILKTRVNHNPREMYLSIVVPRLKKFFKKTNTVWKFQIFF